MPNNPATGLAARLSVLSAPSEPEPVLDDEVVRSLLPELRAPEPHCFGDPPVYWDNPLMKRQIPRVTTSIDAAVRVVRLALPAGTGYSLSCPQVSLLRRPGETPYLAVAEIFVPDSDGRYSTIEAAGDSEALALCAAAVTARSRLPKSHD